GIGRADETVARSGQRKVFIDTERYAHDVGCVRLDRYVAPVAVKQTEWSRGGVARECERCADGTEHPGDGAASAREACYRAFEQAFRLAARPSEHIILPHRRPAARSMVTLPLFSARRGIESAGLWKSAVTRQRVGC